MRTDNIVSKCVSIEPENEDHGWKRANTAICDSFLFYQLWDRCAFHQSVKMLVCETSGGFRKPQTALLNFSEDYQYLYVD